MTYPMVTSEHKTLDLVISGASIARYGDGEFKMCRGAGIKSQCAHPVLAERLREILKDSGQCLVGIPNIRSDTPKAEFWGKYMRYAAILSDRPYVSSFITRPDSAPWINEDSYWDRLESLWKGQKVTLVRGSSKSFTAADLSSASEVREIVASRQHAFGEYKELLERIGKPKRVLICLGPTATVMAVDLCKRGIHAIDLGHCGMFWRKRQRGEPMLVLEKDKGQAA